MHTNSLEAYRSLILSGHAISLEGKCYQYIKTHQGTYDEAIAKAVRGDNARRQDVAPRINKLIATDLIKECGSKIVNNRTVRILEVLNNEPVQQRLI